MRPDYGPGQPRDRTGGSGYSDRASSLSDRRGHAGTAGHGLTAPDGHGSGHAGDGIGHFSRRRSRVLAEASPSPRRRGLPGRPCALPGQAGTEGPRSMNSTSPPAPVLCLVISGPSASFSTPSPEQSVTGTLAGNHGP